MRGSTSFDRGTGILHADLAALGYVVLAYGVTPFLGAVLPLVIFLAVAAVLYRRVV